VTAMQPRREFSLHNHEHYEEMCALAATGQASLDELADLKAHLAECPSCRCIVGEFAQVSAQALLGIAAKRAPYRVPEGMIARFLARARSEGIAISRDILLDSPKPAIRWFIPALSAVTASVAVIGVLIVAGPHFSKFRSANNRSTSQVNLRPIEPPSHRSTDRGATEEARLQRDLAVTRAKLTAMESMTGADRRAVDAANRERDSLTARLLDLEKENAGLRANDSEYGNRIAQLNQELEKLKSEKKAGEIAALVDEAELRDLRQKLAEQSDALRVRQELVVRGSDVRDLIVARNLHIIDVHDRDGNGKSLRPFGRIFYTEGKSLIFYAYDLADPRKLDAKISFYAWGERLGAGQPARNLGIFHNDDANDGRWILTFDDPKVLAQVDSVFVTVETAKKSVTEPKGKQILFAFLGSKPNHP
jgi:hypothetical protein